MENSQKASAVGMKGKDPLLDLALRRLDPLVRMAALEQRLLGARPRPKSPPVR